MLLYLLWEYLVDVWDTFTIELQANARSKRKERKRLDGYLNATAEMLRGTVEQDVFELVTYRLMSLHKMHLIREISGFAAVNAAQRIYWIANAYEQKVNGGGLCGFLASEYGYAAPLIPWVLKAIGADEHLALYCSFIQENNVDSEAFSKFGRTKSSDRRGSRLAEELRARYNFDAFDEKYMELAPIEGYIIRFVRENAEEILK